MRRGAWPSILALSLLATGCAQHEDIDLTGKECPCGGDWVCDEVSGTCVRGSGGGGGRDAGPRGDGGPGADTGGGGEDAGPGVDSGMMMTPGTIWIEAEDGTVEAPMMTVDDAAASNGQYVTVDPATAAATAAAPATGKVSFTFTVTEAGDYTVWGRVTAPMEANDSFWVGMDGATPVQWNNIGPFATFDWDDVHDSLAADATVTFTLDAADHTLDIFYREPGALLDKIVVTNDPTLMPTGEGG